MYLLQLLLPVRAADGKPFPKSMYDAVRSELAERFGGCTAWLRSPAAGLWEDEDGACVRDEVLLVEVMADSLERDWWRGYRRTLEGRFEQDEILLRAHPVERL